tara:strand:- start:623 stop:1012 length:390 start_codon:yes stop_codon:yes gene_type:complete
MKNNSNKKSVASNNNNHKHSEHHYFTYGAIIPIINAAFLIYIGRKIPNNLWFLDFEIRNAYKALIIGTVLAFVNYHLKKLFIKEKNALSKAVLLGLLSAEILIFVNEDSKNSMATITLFLFFYFHAVEH